ncbi:MAG: sulfatase, partial [Planctomycetota bacterium]
PAMNVVLITLDTMRADYLSSYGFESETTPNLDALAEKGVLFELAHSTAAVTPVSHASILTGLNQYHHRLRVLSALSGYRLPRDIPTLATLLKNAGYQTLATHSAFPVSAYFGLDQGFDTFLSFDATVDVEVDAAADSTAGGLASWDVSRYQRRSDETTDLALASIRAAKAPFFLWVHYWDSHDTALRPPEGHWSYPGNLASLPPEERRKALYVTEVKYQDEQIGRLLDGLSGPDKEDNTLIVVTADHGEGLGDHGWGAHRILYEEQVHVPLIIHVPGGPKGRRVRELVGAVDIVPTILDYIGVVPPPSLKFDGRSLRGLMDGKPDQPRTLYADQINGYDFNAKMVNRRPQADFLYSVTRDPWKLIYRPSFFDRSELYNLREDPRETRNLWAVETNVRRDLLQELARRDSWCTQRFPETGEDDPDREAAAGALESLGYVGGESADAASDPRWAWTCIDHQDVLMDKRGVCPREGCGLRLILRAREDAVSGPDGK